MSTGHKYDCGVELSQEGLHGRPDYIRAVTGPLSLHSWYLMLWANFGTFCVGLITQPDGHEQIGTVLSDFHSDIRHFCMAQMQTFWIQLNMGINCTTEGISLFIRKAMTSYVGVSDLIVLYKYLQMCTRYFFFKKCSFFRPV